MLKKYILNVLISIDQFFNALLGGSPQETISMRAYKAQQEGKIWGCILCEMLSNIQKNHCQKSVEPDNGSNVVIPD